MTSTRTLCNPFDQILSYRERFCPEWGKPYGCWDDEPYLARMWSKSPFTIAPEGCIESPLRAGRERP